MNLARVELERSDFMRGFGAVSSVINYSALQNGMHSAPQKEIYSPYCETRYHPRSQPNLTIYIYVYIWDRAFQGGEHRVKTDAKFKEADISDVGI